MKRILPGISATGSKEAGFTVTSCREGVEGLHLAACERWDVVILDRMLPGQGASGARRCGFLLSAVPDGSIERGDKVKGWTSCTVDRDHPAPCDIGDATCAGDKGASSLDGNPIYRIKPPRSLIFTVNFIAVCRQNLELT
jgi:hypothetical protein